MYKLMIGNNFDEKLVDSLIEINQKYTDSKITEVFGSIQKLNYIKTARPDFRLPNIDIEKFKRICLKLYENNIIVNYTINTPIVDHREINKDGYERFVRELYDYKVRRLTVAHPLIIKVLGSIDLDIGVELSTIFRISHPRQLYDLKKFNKNLNKVCLDVMRNRDYNYLKDMKKHCDELEIELELIANEFCIYQCTVRDQCYHAHVLNKSIEDTKYFGNWPMGYCITKREKEPIEWLYANFILPQHMKVYYEEFGIDRFKITGRTALTSYVKWVIECYLSQQYNGNLLDLWQDVKNIQRLAQGKQEYLPTHYTIDCKVIDEEFIRWYFKNPVSMEIEEQHIKSYFERAFITK